MKDSRTNSIIFDVDGVILRFCDDFISFINKELGENFSVENIKDYDIAKSLKLDSNEFKRLSIKFHNSYKIRKLSYYPLVKEFINKLHEKYKIILVTSMPKINDLPIKRRDNLSELKFDDIIFENKKYMVANKIEPTYIFEDCPSTIDEYLSFNNGTFETIFVPERPWNISFKNIFSKKGKVSYFKEYNELENKF